MSAVQVVNFNPIKATSPNKDAAHSERLAAEWLRDLAKDIDSQRVTMFELRMDAFGRVQGSVNVSIPEEWLEVDI